MPLARADVRALGNLVGGCCTSGYECVNHALLAGRNREARDPAARLAAEKIDAVFEEVVRQRAGLRARTPSSCLGACRGGQSQSQCESVTLGTHMCAQTASRLSTHCVVNVGSVQPLYLVDGFATCRRGSGKGPHHLGVLQLVLQRGALEIACMRASVTQTLTYPMHTLPTCLQVETDGNARHPTRTGRGSLVRSRRASALRTCHAPMHGVSPLR